MEIGLVPSIETRKPKWQAISIHLLSTDFSTVVVGGGHTIHMPVDEICGFAHEPGGSPNADRAVPTPPSAIRGLRLIVGSPQPSEHCVVRLKIGVPGTRCCAV